MTTESTYCRLCDSRCGLLAETAEGQLVALHPDPSDPISGGYICDTATTSTDALRSAQRITEPMKRVQGVLTPVSWDVAIDEIGQQLRAIRKRSGPKSMGVYMGADAQRSTRTLARSLAFGVGMGTPHIFSEQCLGAGAQIWMTEQMIGHAAPLISDLSRAHYVLLLSGDQREAGWGPLSPGMSHEQWIEHSRQTKKTKVIVADPRRTPLAEAMDQHLPIRPGTEPFLLMGILVATVKGGWIDQQFVADYVHDYDRLESVLTPWNVEMCAELCGLDAPTVSGIALKFSRAAMAVAHPGPNTFNNAHGALGAWAWLALHTVTANLLRPGGQYESRGVFDLFDAISMVPTSGAPQTRATGYPLTLLQAPATALFDELTTPGEGQVSALITVSGNPLGTLPGPDALSTPLQDLELLVSIGQHEDETAAVADWVLPATHPWEQASITLHDNTILPFKGAVWTPAIANPAGESRPEHDILSSLYKAARPGIRGSVWGPHLAMMAQVVARADLEQWEQRLFSFSDTVDLESVPGDQRRVNLGECDRSTWRPSTDTERIELMPGILQTITDIAPPTPNTDLVLRTTRLMDRAPDRWHRTGDHTDLVVHVHPDLGHKDGDRVQVTTQHGTIHGRVVCDDRLRTDMVDIPFGHGAHALNLLDPRERDPHTGAPVFDGLSCTIHSA